MKKSYSKNQLIALKLFSGGVVTTMWGMVTLKTSKTANRVNEFKNEGAPIEVKEVREGQEFHCEYSVKKSNIAKFKKWMLKKYPDILNK